MTNPLHVPVQDPKSDKHNPEHYKVGTLTYTKAGLVTLFLLLLWGDFCFTLMEAVVPSILPVFFNDIGAPNWALGLILTTIPSLMTALINPFVSFCSDRFRSRWGRRIPFLAGATPFIVLFLVLLGYSEAIGRWVHATLLGGNVSEMMVLISVIGVFMVCFQFFNLFVTSVFYYLFNDVVPQAFLARFMALFKMVSVGAWSVYNYFVFKYASTHMQEIFLAAGVLYLVAFAMMCWNVKEGDYPPPPENVDKQTGLASWVKTYARECFTHRFYWYFFLANGCSAMGWGVSGAYDVLIATKVVGMDLEGFGKVSAICGFIALAMLYPAGMVADRFHPLRMFIVGWILTLLITPVKIVFLFVCHKYPVPEAVYFWTLLLIIGVPLRILAAASEMPMFMRLLPKERYGQFCSANALVRAVLVAVGGVACGAFLDFTKRFGSTPDECYRFVQVWNLFFILLTILFLYLLHREWKKMGGLASFEPPQPVVAVNPPST